MFSGLENFPSPPVCSVSVVLFRLFGSAEHAGRSESRLRNRASKSSCEIKLRLDRFSHASGLFRFRGSVSALRVGGTRGAVEIEVVKSASAGRASYASGLFRFRDSVPALRVGGTLGAVEIEGAKSGFEIGLRRVECFSERKTSFDYIFVYNIKRKGWCHWW